MTRDRRDALLFWTLAVLVLGAGFGLRDPWPADEPRFALAARAMVESGQWLFPMRGDELYPDKPPMFMWMQATLLVLTGNLRIAFLLPSLLAALGTLWLVSDLGRRLWSRRAGLLAAGVVLLTLQFTWQAKKAQIDPVLVFWVTLGCYGLLRHVLQGPRWGWWMVGWAAAGFGTITKGVGVIALLMLVPAAIASLRGWPGVRVHARDARFWLGPLAFVLACCTWLVPMLVAALSADAPELRAYAQNILFKQTAVRYAGASHDHDQPWWYFLEVVPTMWLPTALLLPWAIPAWRRRWRRRDPRIALPLAWCVLVLLFFSIPDGKRDMYILPALPMLALALAPLLPGLLRRVGVQRALLGFVLLFGAAALLAGGLVWLRDPPFEARFVAERGLASGDALGLAIAAIGAWMLLCAAWFRRRRAAHALALGLAGLWLVVGLVAMPMLNDASSARGLMREVGGRIGPDAQLAMVGWREQNLLMADRPAATFGFRRDPALQWRDALAWQRAAPASRWLLVEETLLPDCVQRAQAQHVGVANRRGWWLLRVDASGACP